jgi:predicted CopG family antitoxin
MSLLKRFMIKKVVKVETVKIKAEIKRKLVRLIGKLEMKYGRKFSIDDAINYLLEKEKKPELLDKAFGIAKGIDLYETLRAERENDEERAKRKFGL